MNEVIQENFDRVFAELKGIREMIAARDARFDRLETMTRSIAVVVARHEEKFDRMESRFVALDKWDKMMGMMEKVAAETEGLQRFKTFADRSVGENYTTLTDHELRIYRLEQRGKEKPS